MTTVNLVSFVNNSKTITNFVISSKLPFRYKNPAKNRTFNFSVGKTFTPNQRSDSKDEASNCLVYDNQWFWQENWATSYYHTPADPQQARIHKFPHFESRVGNTLPDSLSLNQLIVLLTVFSLVLGYLIRRLILDFLAAEGPQGQIICFLVLFEYPATVKKARPVSRQKSTTIIGKWR